MAYFGRFPVITDYEMAGRTFEVMDITKRVGFKTTDNESTYLKHNVEDGETPIILADRVYDDSNLYWVIMLFNQIHDIENDWPLDNVSLDAYCNRVYENPYALHHYESSGTGLVVDEDHPEYDKVSITNLEYETRLNDKKRMIKIPIPQIANKIVQEFNRLIQL